MSGLDFALLVAILSFGAFVQALSGFGFALVAVPLASVVVAPSRAVVIVSLASLLTSVRNAVAARGQIERPVANRMTLAALVAMPLGLVVLETVDDRPLRLTIGVVVAIAAVLIALGVELRRGTVATDLITGFISGVLNTSTGTNGPPLVIGLRAHRLGIVRFRGTMAAVFIASGVVALVLFALRGRIGGREVAVAAISLPFQLGTAFVGDAAGRRLPDHRFDHMVIGLLLASAITAILAAILS